MTRFKSTFGALRLLGTAALLVGAAGAQAALPMYRITVIPSPAGQSSCQVLGLNDAGQVTGRCNAVGFVWSQATGAQSFSDPLFPGASLSPFAINNAGVVAGSRYQSNETRNPGFTWDAVNGFSYFGTADKMWEVRSINDLNQAVGYSAAKDDSSFVWKAFQWSAADGIGRLHPLLNRRTLAYDINNAGQIAGTTENLDIGITHAVRYEPSGGFTRVAPANRTSSAFALNGQGHVVGYIEKSRHNAHAFVWTPEAGTVDIDPRPLRSDESFAFDINDAGQVVGKMGWVGSGGNYKESAFYWDAANGMQNLLTLLDPSDPLTSQLVAVYPDASVRINAQGQIILNGYSQGDEPWAMLLTPVPPLARNRQDDSSR